MWKFNKYNIGEIVRHKDIPTLEFRVMDIFCDKVEKPEAYRYFCLEINEYKINGMYVESVLSLIRKATPEELLMLLNFAANSFENSTIETLLYDIKKGDWIRDELKKYL